MVSAHSKRAHRAFAEAVMAGVPEGDRERVRVLVPEEVPAELATLSAPAQPQERVVRGYVVKGGTVAMSAEDQRGRSEAVARIIARAMTGKS